MELHSRPQGYKVKKRKIGNPDDPVWQGIVKMQATRIEAMRKAIETGERYRDPYDHLFPPRPQQEDG